MDILNSKNYEYRANTINQTQVPSETKGTPAKSEPTGQAANPTSPADRSITLPEGRVEPPSTADQTIIKALAASGLPMSDRNRTLVRELLNHKLPVDKQTLQMFAKLAAVNRSASALTLVLMYKNQIPITPANLRQFEAYQNGNHQLLKDIQSLTKNITDLLNSLQKSQETGNAAGPENKVSSMPSGAASPEGVPLPGGAVPQETVGQSYTAPAAGTTLPAGYGEEKLAGYQSPLETPIIPTGLDVPESVRGDATASPAGATANIMESEARITGSPLSQPSSGAPLSAQIISSETGLLQADAAKTEALPLSTEYGAVPPAKTADQPDIITAQGVQPEAVPATEDTDSVLKLKDLLPWLSETLEASRESDASTEGTSVAKLTGGENTLLKNIVQLPSEGTLTELSPEILNHLDKLLRQKWTLTPEQLSDKNSLKDLYKKLEDDLNKLDGLIRFHRETEEIQQSKEPVRNLQDNLQFMKALNQLFSYVQLPLRFQDREVHGEFYVFNKKNALHGKKDILSVLLHLDMTELGTLNIHMKLERDQIQATFAVDNAEAGSIIQDHLPELITALTRKGYQLKARVEKQEQPQELIKDFLEQDPSGNSIQTFSFDTRA